MDTETVIVLPKGEDFEIIVQHDQSGSAYGMSLSKNAYEQLRQHFVSGSLPLDKVDQLLKMQIEECRYFAQRCARDYGAASADYDKWIAETPIITLHRQ